MLVRHSAPNARGSRNNPDDDVDDDDGDDDDGDENDDKAMIISDGSPLSPKCDVNLLSEFQWVVFGCPAGVMNIRMVIEKAWESVKTEKTPQCPDPHCIA